jgi:ATP-binding cassette subfamily B protein/subfamily B ATP-binding cassette protein MsbA
MKNFLRAVKLGMRYRFTLLGAVVCSLIVALFWGFNIGTIYPVVEIVFQGKAMPDWIDEEIARLEGEIQDRQQWLDEQQQQPVAQGDSAFPEIEMALFRQQADEQALAWRQSAQPWIHRYLPITPFDTLLLMVAALLLGTLVKDLFLMASMILVERFSQLSTFGLRKEFYRRTLRMDLAAFGHDRRANLLARFTNDMNGVNQGINSVLGKAVREPLKMIVCLVGAAWICWRLLILSLLVVPLALYLVARLAMAIKRANRRAMEEMSQLYGVLDESFSGIMAVKSFTMESYERGRFHRTAKEYYRRAMRIMTFNSLTRPTTEMMGMIIVSLALVSGGYMVLNQETHLLGIRMSNRPLGFGALITFYALLIGASDPLRKLADVFNVVQRSSAALDRIYEMLDREPAIVDCPEPKPVPVPFKQLVFQGVNFEYLSEEPLLKDINLTIEQGETVAIVGANGSGKSTLLNLVPRFYDPTGGQILINDTPLPELKIKQLRRLVGVVTQQTILFDDTILNNIRYGSPHASRDEIVEAARKARADEFICQFEQGYETIAGESGGRLSGGQRQRIALARAILRDPQILLLDEATSQVDVESEKLIHQVLEEFLRQRTTIMITHRLSTLALAKRIIVLEEGRIVDVGTSEELSGRCEIFRSMCQIPLRESA